jgi:hypothetical protein
VGFSAGLETNITPNDSIPCHRGFFSKTVDKMFDSYALFNISNHKIKTVAIICREFLDSLIPLLKRFEKGIQIHENTSH